MAIDTVGEVTEERITIEGDSNIRGVDSEEPVDSVAWVCLVGSDNVELMIFL